MSLPTTISKDDRQTLLRVARQSVAYGLAHGRSMPVRSSDYADSLAQNRATFVTLEIAGRLRGCIGMLQATRPLIEDVAANAFAAAFSDPRFAPLTNDEFDQLDIHISVLSPPQAMTFTDEQDVIRQLRPGVDGIILEEGPARGTFLPAVWESLPEPPRFWAALKHKAGLLDEYWSRSVKVWRYTAESIP